VLQVKICGSTMHSRRRISTYRSVETGALTMIAAAPSPISFFQKGDPPNETV
jgi:hypothetical protein